MTQDVVEQAVLLGERRAMVGIMTQAVTLSEPDLPAIVILNTGLIHRVGHHRMFVTMSRTFAKAGFRVLRFDFSGVGDSDPRIDELSPMESCLADIGETLDWLTKQHQVSRIILLGLCSGADHAVLYSPADPRVIAAVLMDPSIPTTARHYVYYTAARLLRLRNWASVVTGRSRLLQEWIGMAQNRLRSALHPKQMPPHDILLRNSLEQAYKKAGDRGVQLLAIFSEEDTRQTYREQMFDAFPSIRFGSGLRLEFLPNSDHTFSRESDRRSLTKLTLEFIISTAGGNNVTSASSPAQDRPGMAFE